MFPNDDSCTVLSQAMGHLASACHTCWPVTGHTSQQLLIQMNCWWPDYRMSTWQSRCCCRSAKLWCMLYTNLQWHWNDFITNRAVADSTNLPSILSTIAARRHSIFGHIRRLPDSTPAHKALKLVMNARSGDAPHDDWNHLAGRPRTSRMSQIVRDTGLTAADAWAVADDRSTWRALRPTAGYAQHWLTDWL